jgi:hypothetical protein
MDQSYSPKLVLIHLIRGQGIYTNNLRLDHLQLAPLIFKAMIIPAENYYNPLDFDLCKNDYRFPNKPISSTCAQYLQVPSRNKRQFSKRMGL